MVEVYWFPGCANCLRTKEFVDQTGLSYVDVNLANEPTAMERLRRLGVGAPAVVVDDRAARGLDLVAVADLIGVDYRPPAILDPAELKARFDTVIAALCRYTAQLSAKRLAQRLPGGNRSVRYLVAHTGTIARKFLEAYDAEIVDSAGVPPAVLATTGSSTDLIGWARDTADLIDGWWVRRGHDDPFDRVLETTWGFRTLHEVMEQTVCHTARHTRELMSWLNRAGIAPDRPLRNADLTGLPAEDPNSDCWTMTQRLAG